MRPIHLLLAGLLALVGPLPLRAAELVMVEQAGCAYCARWDREIAPIWPKTAAGAAAPLRRIDLRAPVPEDLDLARRAVFTPTFILVDDAGRELARLEGYPGEDFFWPLIEQMLRAHTGFDPAAAAPTTQQGGDR
jgi:hypothetical protein